MLHAAAKRKREASKGEGTSVSDAEMAQRLGAESTAAEAGLQADVTQYEGDGTRADLPGKGSKRAKNEGKAAAAAVEAQADAFAVPPAMPAAMKAGSMRKHKKRDRSRD